jgi:hypothetical protein
MAEEKATKRPWQHDHASATADYPDRGAAFITGTNLDGLVGAALPLPTELESNDFSRVDANAALIVRAINQHDALMECAKALRELVSASDLLSEEPESIVIGARYEIAKRDSLAALQRLEASNAK